MSDLTQVERYGRSWLVGDEGTTFVDPSELVGLALEPPVLQSRHCWNLVGRTVTGARIVLAQRESSGGVTEEGQRWADDAMAVALKAIAAAKNHGAGELGDTSDPAPCPNLGIGLAMAGVACPDCHHVNTVHVISGRRIGVCEVCAAAKNATA